MASLFLNILFHLTFFDLVFISIFGYARDMNGHTRLSTHSISRKERTNLFIPSRESFQKYDSITDNTSGTNATKLVEKKTKFSSLSLSSPFGYFKDHGGYHTLSSEAAMFYSFFKSRDVKSNSVMIWLTGGPGGTSNVGLFYENGPFRFANQVENDFSLTLNNFGWDEVVDILYIDQPIGTGLSYENDRQEIRQNQKDVVDDLYDFLQEFFYWHPGYEKKKFFIAGEDYAARFASSLGDRILQGPNDESEIPIKLKGIAIGNALIDYGTQYGTIPQYAYENDLITAEDYIHLKDLVDLCIPSTQLCASSNEREACLMAYYKCHHILVVTNRAITNNLQSNSNYLNIKKPRESDEEYYYDYSKMINFLTSPEMENVFPGLVPEGRQFYVANSYVSEQLKPDWAKHDTLNELRVLLEKNISLLFYTGIWDLVNNHIGMELATKNIPWLERDEFADSVETPWKDDHGNTVGLAKNHGPLTYLKVLNAGHQVPRDQPEVALDIIRKWMREITY